MWPGFGLGTIVGKIKHIILAACGPSYVRRPPRVYEKLQSPSAANHLGAKFGAAVVERAMLVQVAARFGEHLAKCPLRPVNSPALACAALLKRAPHIASDQCRRVSAVGTSATGSAGPACKPGVRMPPACKCRFCKTV